MSKPAPGVRSPLGRVLVALLSVVLISLAGAPGAASSEPTSSEPLPIPAGWNLAGYEALAHGAEHFTLSRPDGPLVVHIIRAPRGELELRAVVSHDRIGGPTASGERTSTMCARLACVAGVNADFARPGSDQPVGAVVSAGRILRSPVGTHHQFSAGWGPLMASGLLEWNARLVSSDLREIAIAGLNDPGAVEGTVLFTPSWGPALRRGSEDLSVVVRFVGGVGELVPSTTASVELVELVRGPADISLAPGTAVLTGSGAAAVALQDLWNRVAGGVAGRRALLRVELGPDAKESVGGTPVLVRDGRAWVQSDRSGFVSGRHPRTVAGWDGAGRVLLVTVDGRQPGHSIGMSLPELADFLVAIGAVEALNLDGGGSTTMVIAGRVVNLPSDRLVRSRGTERLAPLPVRGDEVLGNVERPVSVALLLVPAPAAGAVPTPVPDEAGAPEPMDGGALALPAGREIQLALPAGDPGSDPTGGTAALVVAPAAADSSAISGFWAALAVLLQVMLAGLAGLAVLRLRPIEARRR